MENKVSPIIIFVVVLVLIAMGIFVYSLMNSSGDSTQGEQTEDNLTKPVVNLTLDTTDENQEEVNILAYASMEDGTEITKIILPNGEEVSAKEATYKVTENGEYTFKVIAENGEETETSITVSNIKEISAFNPYIPEGFSKVEDTSVETGFIIKDTYGNEYVWVPVENGSLMRDTNFDSKYEETDSTASALVNSVAQNYGFYIARFEASEYDLNGEKVAASMIGQTPWTNITYLEAAQYANDVSTKFGYEDVKSAMLNSYVWDTVLKWFDKSAENYSTSVDYGNYSGTIYPTGATQKDIIYNICDIAGNVREWTTEIYKDQTTGNEDVVYRVVRGGSASLGRTPKSHTGYAENIFENYWGFRIILYK